jgi:hypothetical protein
LSLLLLFLSAYFGVFLLGAQSLLVNNGRYGLAFFNSFLIGGCHLALYKLAPAASGWEVVAYLTGGPFGIVSAMWLLRSLHRRPG